MVLRHANVIVGKYKYAPQSSIQSLRDQILDQGTHLARMIPF